MLVLLSCDSKHFILDEARVIQEGAWNYSDIKEYDFEITDTTKVYNIALIIDHSEEYAYQNLYIKIYTLFPSGKKMAQQVSLELADKFGQWYGDCGTNCELAIDLQKTVYFNEVGKYVIQIEQYMRMSPLKGINGFTVQVEDTGQSRVEN